ERDRARAQARCDGLPRGLQLRGVQRRLQAAAAAGRSAARQTVGEVDHRPRGAPQPAAQLVTRAAGLERYFDVVEPVLAGLSLCLSMVFSTLSLACDASCTVMASRYSMREI